MKKAISVFLTLALVLSVCSFTLAAPTNLVERVTITIGGRSYSSDAFTAGVAANEFDVAIDVPFGTDLTSVGVVFTAVGGTTLTTASFPGVNFANNNPSTFQVTDNTDTEDITVTINVLPNTACDVTFMAVDGASAVRIANTGTVGNLTGTLTILLPRGIELTTLKNQAITAFMVSTNATDVLSITTLPVDITQDTLDLEDIYNNGGVTLEVTAQDGTIRTYNIIVGFASTSGNGYYPGWNIPTTQQPGKTTTPVQQPVAKNNATTTAKVKVMDGKKTYTTLAKEDGFTFTTIDGKNGKFLVVSLSGGSYGTVDMSKCEGTFSTISVMATVTSSTYTYDDMSTKSANRVEKLAKGDTVMIVGFYKGWVITEDGNYIPLSKVKLEVV